MRAQVIEELKGALKAIKKLKGFAQLIPEVGTNLAYALPNAKVLNEVAAIPGRIRNAMGKPCFLAPKFGASQHMARVVLTVMKYAPELRCAMNIRYGKDVLEVCKKLNLCISSFDRRREPLSLKHTEGATLPWGIEKAIARVGKVPDVIYDLGDWGKEPNICIIGRNPAAVVRVITKILKNLSLISKSYMQ